MLMFWEEEDEKEEKEEEASRVKGVVRFILSVSNYLLPDSLPGSSPKRHDCFHQVITNTWPFGQIQPF